MLATRLVGSVDETVDTVDDGALLSVANDENRRVGENPLAAHGCGAVARVNAHNSLAVFGSHHLAFRSQNSVPVDTAKP